MNLSIPHKILKRSLGIFILFILLGFIHPETQLRYSIQIIDAISGNSISTATIITHDQTIYNANNQGIIIFDVRLPIQINAPHYHSKLFTNLPSNNLVRLNPVVFLQDELKIVEEANVFLSHQPLRYTHIDAKEIEHSNSILSLVNTLPSIL